MTRARFPHPLALLTGGILLGAALSYVVPAGEYDRREDPATGRRVVVAGTYHRVEPQPVGPFAALVAIPKGMADAGSVIFFVFLIGGALTVVDRTGALRQAVDGLVRVLARRESWVIPITSVVFGLGGALQNTAEEVIALVPILLILTRRLGYDALTAAAMSLGAAAVGASFSPINPFQVGIAQKIVELPLLTGLSFRVLFLAPALGLWIWGTMRYAANTRTSGRAEDGELAGRLDARRAGVLALVLVTFAVFIFGVLRLGWDFDQMAALFFALGVAAGLVAGLRLSETADAFVEGFRSMAYAALLIGFARAIYIVLDEGRIVDTLVHGLFTPLEHLPVALSAFGMMAVQVGIHLPVPSVSGQAVLTLPVLVPLSDLLGLPRQVTVLTYQYGAGLCELLTPTNGALMAVLAAAGVSYDRWLKFAVPLFLGLFALGALAVAVGIAIGLS